VTEDDRLRFNYALLHERVKRRPWRDAEISLAAGSPPPVSLPRLRCLERDEDGNLLD